MFLRINLGSTTNVAINIIKFNFNLDYTATKQS